MLILLLLVAVVYADLAPQVGDSSDYLAWKQKHGVTYEESEDKYRLFLFRQKQAEVNAHNQNPKNTWTKGINQFSALTDEEFETFYLGARPPKVQVSEDSSDDSADSDSADSNSADSNSADSNSADSTDDVSRDDSESDEESDSNESDPDSDTSEESVSVKAPIVNTKKHPIVGITPVDWDAQGKVTSIKNQGQCGSCWAFSTVAAIEASRLIEENVSSDLSEQQLVNCVYENRTGFPNSVSGCQGGWMDQAFDYIIKNNRGIKTEADAPYTGVYVACPEHGGPIKIKSYTESPDGKCGRLRKLIKTAPVTVAVCAGGWSSYSGGVFRCRRRCVVNHAVLAYGYQSNRNWLLKNSWGAGWGINGTMILKRGNKCKICNYGGERANIL